MLEPAIISSTVSRLAPETEHPRRPTISAEREPRPDLLARAIVNSVLYPVVHEIEMEHDAGRAVDARGGDVVEETCRAPRRFVIVARDAVIVGLEAP